MSCRIGELLSQFLLIVWMKQGYAVKANQLFRSVAGEIGSCRTGVGNGAIGCEQEKRIGTMFDQ